MTIITRAHLKYFIFTTILVVLGSASEVLSLGAIAPLMSSIVSVDDNQSNSFGISVLNDVVNYFQFDNRIIALLVIFLIVNILRIILLFTRDYLKLSVMLRVRKFCQVSIYKDCLEISPENLLNFPKGSLIYYQTTLANQISSYYMSIIALGATTLDIVLIGGLLVLSANIQFMIIIICFIAVGIPVAKFQKKKMKVYGYNIVSSLKDQTIVVNETLGGIVDIVFHQKKMRWINKFLTSINLYNKNKILATIMRSGTARGIEFVIIVMLCVVGIIVANKGESAMMKMIPVLSLYAMAVIRLGPKLGELFVNKSLVDIGRPALREYLSLLEKMKHDIETYKHGKTEELSGNNFAISFKNVSFNYKKDISVLENVSLNIDQGSMVAIVGDSGSGKSTIIKILLGELAPQKGVVAINDIPMKVIKPECIYRIFGYTPQAGYIFNDTIKANITLGSSDDQIDSDNFSYATEISCMDKVVYGNKTYETQAGEQGSELSGGQKQRISLARTMYKGARVIILDEAINSLDEQSKNTVLRNIKRSCKNEKQTVIVITHDLNGMVDYDNIIVLSSESKGIAEQGKHSELLANNKLYSKLWANRDKSHMG